MSCSVPTSRSLALPGCCYDNAAEQNTEAGASAFHEQYVLGAKLGSGCFSQIRIASRAKRGPALCHEDKLETHLAKKLAVKIVDDLKGKLRRLKVYNEVSAWMAVGSHKNCMQLFDVFYTPDMSYIVMERCNRGLLHHIQSMPEVSELTLGCLFFQMLSGLAHLHESNVVHRDIKSDCVWIGGEDGRTVKLGDFGSATSLPTCGSLRGVFGTAPYVCPEMLANDTHNEKADMWSLGVLVYSLFYGDLPYLPLQWRKHEMYTAIRIGIKPLYGPVLPTGQPRNSDAVCFVKTLLERNPLHRLSAVEALCSPFMQIVTLPREIRQNCTSLRPLHTPFLFQTLRWEVPSQNNPHSEATLDAYLNKMQMDWHSVGLDKIRREEDDSFDDRETPGDDWGTPTEAFPTTTHSMDKRHVSSSRISDCFSDTTSCGNSEIESLVTTEHSFRSFDSSAELRSVI